MVLEGLAGLRLEQMRETGGGEANGGRDLFERQPPIDTVGDEFHGTADAIIAGCGQGLWIVPVAEQENLLERIHSKRLAPGEIAAEEVVGIKESAGNAVAFAGIGDAQLHEAAMDRRPIEQRAPCVSRLEMGPQQLPAPQRRLDPVVVDCARPQQHPIARPSDDLAGAVAEAAASAEGVDQQPILDAACAIGAITGGLAEMARDDPENSDVRGFDGSRHSRILYGFGNPFHVRALRVDV